MKGNHVALVITYNPNFKSLSFIIHENLQFSCEDQYQYSVIETKFKNTQYNYVCETINS